jgi:hypothetical protein
MLFFKKKSGGRYATVLTPEKLDEIRYRQARFAELTLHPAREDDINKCDKWVGKNQSNSKRSNSTKENMNMKS